MYFCFLKCSLPSYPHEPQQKTYHILKFFVKCMYFYNIQEELSQRFFHFLQIYQNISLKLWIAFDITTIIRFILCPHKGTQLWSWTCTCTSSYNERNNYWFFHGTDFKFNFYSIHLLVCTKVLGFHIKSEQINIYRSRDIGWNYRN